MKYFKREDVVTAIYQIVEEMDKQSKSINLDDANEAIVLLTSAIANSRLVNSLIEKISKLQDYEK